jgi:hypothetical protein
MFKNIKPYDLLGITGLLLFAVSFFVPFQIADIHFHDTYYIFEMPYVFTNVAGLALALFTVCVFIKQNVYSSVLSWIYTLLTILTIIVIIVFLCKASYAYRPGFSDWTAFKINNRIIIAAIIIFILAQVLLISNLVIGIFKQPRRTNIKSSVEKIPEA